MDHDASATPPAFHVAVDVPGSGGKSVPFANWGCPAAGGSGKVGFEPELTPQG
jgi:hypothetical protein